MRRGRCPEVHHSDQGVQYAATAYTALLVGSGVSISMAAVGKPEENGYTERLMRTIKEEEVDLTEYRDFADAYDQLGRFLDDVYNPSSSGSGSWGGQPRPCDRESTDSGVFGFRRSER